MPSVSLGLRRPTRFSAFNFSTSFVQTKHHNYGIEIFCFIPLRGQKIVLPDASAIPYRNKLYYIGNCFGNRNCTVY